MNPAGKCALVQMAVPVWENSQCFLFDVLDKAKDDPLICLLRNVLESDSVVKIIHDFRMDSDALHHILDIKLSNVHDKVLALQTHWKSRREPERTTQRKWPEAQYCPRLWNLQVQS